MILPTAGLSAGTFVAAAAQQSRTEQTTATVGHTHGSVYKGFQLQMIRKILAHSRNLLHAQFTGENDAFHPSGLLPDFCGGCVGDIGLCADVDGKLRYLLMQQHSCAQIADNGSIHAAGRGLLGCFHHAFQLIILGKDIHGHIEFGIMLMNIFNGLSQLDFVKIACKGTQTVAFHATIYGICAKTDSRLQLIHTAHRRKQLHLLHGICHSVSYSPRC